MSNIPKKHHLIPRSLIKFGWGDTVWKYDIDGYGSLISKSAGAATVKESFNTIKEDSFYFGSPDTQKLADKWVIETIYSKVESDSIPYLKWLNIDNSAQKLHLLTSDDGHNPLVNLLLLQSVRSPEAIDFCKRNNLYGADLKQYVMAFLPNNPDVTEADLHARLTETIGNAVIQSRHLNAIKEQFILSVSKMNKFIIVSDRVPALFSESIFLCSKSDGSGFAPIWDCYTDKIVMPIARNKIAYFCSKNKLPLLDSLNDSDNLFRLVNDLILNFDTTESIYFSKQDRQYFEENLL